MPIPNPDGSVVFDQAPAVMAVEARAQMLERLLNLKQNGLRSQAAILIARLASGGDANYIAQNLPIPLATASALDRVLFHGVLDVLNIDHEEADSRAPRWFFPWRDGGMGLSSVTHSADALLLTTWLTGIERASERFNYTSTTALLEHLPACSQLLGSLVQSLLAKGSDIPNVQSALKIASEAGLASRLRLAACARSRQSFISGADGDNQVACNENAGKGAGAWLSTPQKPGHWFTNQGFVSLVRLRMHLPVYSEEGHCMHRSKPRPGAPATLCSSTRDRCARHVMLCQTGGGILARHNALRDVLAEAIVDHSGLPAPIEQHIHVYSDDRHPDIQYLDWRGREVHIDVEVVSPHGRAEVARTRPGAAIAAAEGVKRRKYARLNLMPAVASHLGRPGNSLATIVKSICRQTDMTARSAAISCIWQDWSCTLQHWNAHILSSAGPLMPP
jgi:hypothetical protein